MNKFLVETLCIFAPTKALKSKAREFLRALNIVGDIINSQKFLNAKVYDKTILMIEPNPNHGECLPSYLKYFKDLGYRVHLMMKQENFDKKIFCKIPARYMPDEIFILSQFAQKKLLQNDRIKEYQKGFIATSEHFYSFNSYFNYLGFEPQFKEGSLIVEHDLRNIEKYNQQACYENGELCVLTNFMKDPKLTTVNLNYFGDVNITDKNEKIVNFIRVGGIDQKRRNDDLIIKSIQNLLEQGITNFKVTIVGSGKLKNLPEDVQDYIDIKGKLSFPQLYLEMEKSDYLLMLLDPTIEANRAYLSSLTTGSKQLILGFLKPCLINEEFAKAYDFDDKNALVYSQNKMAETMKTAIEMSPVEYCTMQNELAKLSISKYEQSLKALERKLNAYLVLFCKSYIGDLDRLEILKKSVDKFNKDKLPFYIVCPQKDLEIIKAKIKTDKEEYELHFVKDEEVLSIDGHHQQSWFTQQVIKLSFYKMGVCNHYIILDSDCYFIQNFETSDFMHDENTPYTLMSSGIPVEPKYLSSMNPSFLKIKEKLNREGLFYLFGGIPCVFSRIILEDLDKNFMQKESLTFSDLIEFSPSEFHWHGEWTLKSQLIQIVPRTTWFFKFYHYQMCYLNDKRMGTTVEDIKKQGYMGIGMQSGWVKDKIYKPSKIVSLRKFLKSFEFGWYHRKEKTFIKNVELFCRKCLRDPIKAFLSKVGT